MTVNKENNNGSLAVSINGRIDTTTAPALEEELKSSFDSCSDITLDFANVDYISSAGLRVLLSAQKTMAKKGGMKLKNVSSEIMEIFEVTGFSDILTIE
ncbi:MAG: STAS domain-containing protein [Oscillospiraceae bacterium]|nr:STAS domain-containing protein [Oscillospiraceae bacterium]